MVKITCHNFKMYMNPNALSLGICQSVRERLLSKCARLKKSGVVKKKNDEEMVLAAKAFSG